MTTHALELSAVSKVYPPPTTVTALADINLVVDAGETVAITGASGAGKSTLLSILGTLERPTAGTVRIAGTEPMPNQITSSGTTATLGMDSNAMMSGYRP